jgi:hypothetical protein
VLLPAQPTLYIVPPTLHSRQCSTFSTGPCRKVDAEALQQIKQQRARAKAEHAANGGSAGQPGAAAAAGTPAMPNPLHISGTLRSVSFDAGVQHASLLRHLSAPPAAPAATSPHTALPAAAAALSSAGGSGCFPPQQGYLAPAAQPGGVPAGLLRPHRSLPTSFSPAQHQSTAPATPAISNAFRAQTLSHPHAGRQGAQAPTQHQHHQQSRMVAVGDVAAAAGLPPPPFADVLPALSLQELLSLRAAVDGLLTQHVSRPSPATASPLARVYAPRCCLLWVTPLLLAWARSLHVLR